MNIVIATNTQVLTIQFTYTSLIFRCDSVFFRSF